MGVHDRAVNRHETESPPKSPSASTRRMLVSHASKSIGRGSTSFALASRLFDRRTRERAWLLYCWCRRCDDIADGQDHGGEMSAIDDPAERLAQIADLTTLALEGHPTGDPAFDALGLVAAECAIPHKYVYDLIEGFALDASGWHPRTEGDLLKYCYHVAGAVGCMMAIVMGVDPEDEGTLERAADLGKAFQLANIARDISEDDAAGRCYIPDEWLVEADIPPGEQMRPFYRSRLADIGWWLADMAQDFEASGRIGAKALPFRSRWAVLAAAGIYGDIAREVATRGQAAWDRRVVVSKRAKLKWVLKALFQASMR